MKLINIILRLKVSKRFFINLLNYKISLLYKNL